jgi:hypothetical protein
VSPTDTSSPLVVLSPADITSTCGPSIGPSATSSPGAQAG